MFVQAESSKNKNNKRGKSEKLPPFELSNSIHMLAQEASFCLYLFLSSNLFLCQEASFWPLWLLCQRRLRLRMRMCVCGLLAAGTRTGTPMCTPIYFFFTLLTYTNTPISQPKALQNCTRFFQYFGHAFGIFIRSQFATDYFTRFSTGCVAQLIYFRTDF